MNSVHLSGRLATDVEVKEMNGLRQAERSSPTPKAGTRSPLGHPRSLKSSWNEPGAQARPGRSMQRLRIEGEITGVRNIVAQSDCYLFPQIRHLFEQILEIPRLYHQKPHVSLGGYGRWAWPVCDETYFTKEVVLGESADQSPALLDLRLTFEDQ